MHDLLLTKAVTKETTMKKSNSSLEDFDVEDVDQPSTSNPFDYKKCDKESKSFTMPQKSKKNSKSFNYKQRPSASGSIYNEVAIVKAYRRIKQELQREDVTNISKKIFPGDKDLLRQIDSANKRRQTVEILLKKMIDSPDEKQSQFIVELKTLKCRKLLVESVDIKLVTNTDLTKYLQANKKTQTFTASQTNPSARKLTFSVHDKETLKDFLHNEEYLDEINDEFLSKFLFSVDQHSRISNAEFQEQRKVTFLIDEMQKCDEEIYKCFTEVLKSLNISDILQNLECEKQRYVISGKNELFTSTKRESLTCGKRESLASGKREYMSGSLSDLDCVHKAKRIKLRHSDEYDVVNANRKNEKIKTEFEDIGLNIENIDYGSIIVTFHIPNTVAWENLKRYCRNGNIDRLVKDIFNVKGIPEILKDGDIEMILSIYESTETTSGLLNDRVRQELLEELDITRDLLSFLKAKRLVDSNIETEIDKHSERKRKVACLLQNILHNNKEGYNLLMESYIKTKNKYLYKSLMMKKDLEVADDRLSKSTIKCKRQDIGNILYRCTALFGVKTEDVAAKLDISERTITCLGISDPICFFDEKSGVAKSLDKRRMEKSFDHGSPKIPKKMKLKDEEKLKKEEKERREAMERKLSLRGKKKQ